MSTSESASNAAFVKKNVASDLTTDQLTASSKTTMEKDLVSNEAPLTPLNSPAETVINPPSELSVATTAITAEEVSDIVTSKSHSLPAVPDATGEVINAVSDSSIISRFDEVTGNLLEFTLFPKLPTELRLMIWKSTMEPRVVVVMSTWLILGLSSPNRNPIIFSVCQESRVAALEEYENLGVEGHPHAIYFSPVLDTVYWWGDSFRHFASESPHFGEVASKIQSLAVPKPWSLTPDFNFFCTQKIFDYHELCFLKNLKELVTTNKYHLWEAATQSFALQDYHLFRHEVGKYSRITPEAKFQTEGTSEWIQEELTPSLKENFEKFGASSDQMIPLAKFLHLDLGFPNNSFSDDWQ